MGMAPVEGRGFFVCSGATPGPPPLPPAPIPTPPSQSAQADTVTSPTTPLLLPRYHCTNLPTINLYPSNSSLLGAHIQHLFLQFKIHLSVSRFVLFNFLQDTCS